MAGGEGSRLRPMTVNRPKPLVPVGNRPIMDHIVRLLKRHNLTEIVATLHYLSDEIEAYFGDGSEMGVKLIHSLEKEPLGTAGSVKQAEEYLRDAPFVIISGDALTDLNITDAIRFHQEKGAQATLVLSRVPNPLEFGVVITSENGRIERFLEKPGWSEVFSDTVNTGIYILQPEVLDRIPAGQNIDWSKDIFPAMLAEGAPLYGYVMDDYWCDVGTIEQYMEAQRHLLQGLANLEVPGSEIEPGIWVGEGSVIEEGVELEGPLVIGRDCRIKSGAQILKNTVIGDGCIVEQDAQISGSVLWEGSYFGRETFVDNAIVCSRCTIKRGTQIREHAVIGDRTHIEVDCVIRPRIKVYPDRTVERGATVTMSLVSGSKWRGEMFRDLGVAGLSNIEITPEFAIRFGLAVGSTFPARSRIVTARDSSRSSRMTKRALIASLLSTGCTVIDMRSAPMPIARHHVRATGSVGGLTVRKQPGNARLTLMEVLDSVGGYIGQAQQRKIESTFFREEFKRTDPDELGVIEVATRAVDMYTQDFFSLLPEGITGRRPRIVIDYGFSSISPIFPSLLARLGVDAITLNGVNDAKAAPRTPEETAAHLRNLSHIVASLKYDFGVLVTDEGERLQVVDDLGIPIEGASLYAVMCLMFARTHPGAKIGMSVSGSERLEQFLSAQGAKVSRVKAHPRDMMAAAQNLQLAFAGDEAGGFIFPELTPGYDAMFGIARLLDLQVRLNGTLSDLVHELPEMHTSRESVPCSWEAKGLVMRRMAELSRDGRADLMDGIKIYETHGWVLVLPDSFEPTFHIHVEADSDEDARHLIEAYRRRIEEWSAEA